jgi:hypothetical protein
MTSVRIMAGTLTASRADRIVSGLLLPYGELGRTNLGRFTVTRGAFTLPTDPDVLTLNRQHDTAEPIGRAVTLTDSDQGVFASFKVARTPEGDAYLDEVDRGERNSLSAEVAGVVLRGGKALAGRLYAAAAVVAGAFPSATLLAEDVGERPDDEDEPIEDGEIADEQTPTDTESVENAPDRGRTEGDMPQDETAPVVEQEKQDERDLKAALPGSLGGASKTKAPATLLASLAGKSMPEAATLLAALDVINQADGAPAQQNQWLGEIYGSRTYVRRFASLIQHANLSALKAIGWRFIDGKSPVVAPYTAGSQPNSNEVKTEQVTLDAARLAAAGAVDRAWIDFPVPEFWDGYFREQTNSYERVLDGLVLDKLVTSATDVEAGTVPEGIATAAAYIVDGAMAILAAERDLPSWAVVGTDLYRDFLLTRNDDLLAYLSASLGLEDGQLGGFKVVPSATLTGQVLVGTKTSATVYELPGAPVRVDTVAISSGQVERGLFGYHAELVNDAKGLALVSAPTGP